ncbi:MAG TPA: phosphate ABC transporter ATP-binding protein [candidate division Zixibacteria bacterium]|nr:phosphate ABC transporter ATP-binding protein [candidate division Zixibacteria bacterium]
MVEKECCCVGSEETGCVEAVQFNLCYGDNHVIKNVSLKFPRETITAIMGPSGCGKSTFFRAINRMNDLIPSVKTQGEILFDGENVYSNKADIYKLRRRIGMVFQRPNPFPMSILDNVAYGLRIHRLAKGSELEDRVVEAIKSVNLWDEVGDRLKANAMELSGGQQQRLCIARALAVEPEVILLDEPTSALDPVSSAKIEEQLAEFIGKYTTIIVTHNVAQAARVAQYSAFMMLGKIIDFGPTKEVFTNPKNELTERYLSGKFG